MEETLIQAITSYGALGIVTLLLWKKMEEKDKQNREDTEKQVDGLKDDIADLKIANREEKAIFNRAIDSFNKAIDNFANTTNKIDKIDCKVDRLESDVNSIKGKVE